MPIAGPTSRDLSAHKKISGPSLASETVRPSRKRTRKTAAPFSGTGAPEAMPWTNSGWSHFYQAGQSESGDPRFRFRGPLLDLTCRLRALQSHGLPLHNRQALFPHACP